VKHVLFLSVVVSLVIFSLCTLALPKEITVWLSFLEPAQRDWLLQRYFPTFEKEKGIKINAVEMPGDEETLRAQLVAGKGPDVVGMAGPSFAPLYIEAGIASPGFLTVGLMNFLGGWNAFTIPVTFLSDPGQQTAIVRIYTLSGQYTAPWEQIFAAIVIMILPLLVLFLSLQRYFVKGIIGGALK
jgi:hypothetical protein